MLSPYLSFGGFNVAIYSLSLALGLALSAAVGGYAARAIFRPAQVIDACLAAIVGGLVGARVEHVLLHWDYFSANLSEALRLNAGGLDWHGAVIGALAGLALVSRLRRIEARRMLALFAAALPLLALAGWIGCAAAACAYGREVDTLALHPAYAVWEARDVYGMLAPRYSTQRFGMILALILIPVGLAARGERRFWLLLGLLSAGMFAIGFVRGDAVPLVAGLRADQWLDIGFVAWSARQYIVSR